MDLNALKLELLERIVELDDPDLLSAIRRVLDAGETGAGPNVVEEGASRYLRLNDRTYTAEEVRDLLKTMLQDFTPIGGGPDGPELAEGELAILEARRQRHLQGASRSYSWEEVEAILKADIKR